MFLFDSLELLYWDCWERFRIPFDARIITIVGPNGSGKTTLLDALRTLLAAKTSEKRDYKKYARRPNKPHSWIISVVTNKRNSKGRPPFFPITSEKVTLACHIAKKGGDWQREYYILPGALSLEEIIALSESSSDIFSKPKGYREYQIELEKAGLSHAMLIVLALEQGATDKLCEYSPKELLKLVYAAFGDKPTLENYEKAIEEQIEAEKEMETLKMRVAKLENQCAALTNKVNNYREYEGLNSMLAKLSSETMAQARYVELYDYIKGVSGNILGLKREIKASEEMESVITEDERQVSAEESGLRDSLLSLEELLKDALEALIEENRKRSIIEAQLSEIRRLGEECKGIEPEPLLPIQSLLESTQREGFSIEHKIKEIEQCIKDLEDEKNVLLSNRLRPERPVELFRKRLIEAGITHTLLYEDIEIIDEKWHVAIESILKGFRFIILLKNPSDRWKVWKMGEEDGYRHFIVGEKGNTKIEQPANSALDKIRLSEDVPEWIRRLLSEIQLVENVEDGKRLPEGTTFVTSKGFIRERRGGRNIAVQNGDFAFGEKGRRKRLEFIEGEIKRLKIEKEVCHKNLEGINGTILSLREKIRLQEILQRYLSRKDEEESLSVSLQALLKEIADLEIKQSGLSEKKKDLECKRLEVARRLTSIGKDIEKVREGLKNSKERFISQRREICEKGKELKKIVIDMPRDWRSIEAISRYKEEFGGIKDVQREIDRIEKRLTEGEWEKNPDIITMKEKVERDYNGERSNLEQKEIEIKETRRVTQDARGAYIDILKASIRFYEKNLKTLSRLAGVDIEVEKPHLENDDMVLREAGLEVRWNFDNKGFTATDDGEGSGGQQVMKSLILLIGLLMAEGDAGGFVFIDEPFAHLDVFNIDRVAEFLLSTNIQYIITTPNTHNTNIYRPSFLTLVTKKKLPDRPFADPPGHLRRMEKEDARA